jgi:hypothetical protein
MDPSAGPSDEYSGVGAALILLCLVSAGLLYVLWTEITTLPDGKDSYSNSVDGADSPEYLRSRMEQCMQRVELVSRLLAISASIRTTSRDTLCRLFGSVKALN